MLESQEHFAMLSKEFQKLFPSHRIALEEICNAIEKSSQNRQCKSCFSSSIKRKFGFTKIRCLDCGDSYCVTTGTFFEGMKKPKAWLAPLWFLANGFLLNTQQLSKVCDVAVSSSWVIVKKVHVLLDGISMGNASDEEKNLHSREFISLYMRRSTETPSRCHPIEEQFVIEEECAISKEKFEKNLSGIVSGDSENIRTSDIEDTRLAELNEEELAILNRITDEPVQIEQLLCYFDSEKLLSPSQVMVGLTMLELKELIKREPGELYRRVELVSSKCEVNYEVRQRLSNNEFVVARISEFIDAIRKAFQGISRKYLQLYLSAISICIGKSKNSLEDLMKSAVQAPSVKLREILSYNTSIEVHL